MPRKLLLPVFAISLALAPVACASDDPGANPTSPSGTPIVDPTSPPGTASPQNFQVAFSEKQRAGYEGVPSSDLDELVDGNTRFAFDLYRQLSSEDGNLFLSPHSISLALSMTYAGASGETEAEMRQALHFTLDQLRLHAAMNALDQELANRGQDAPADEKLRLEIANSLWGQQGFPFAQRFLDTLAENYGSGMRLVDYVDPETREQARLAINRWVEDNTEERIKDLIPQGVIDDMTRLVLVNAIYFKASWLYPFDEDNTADARFTLRDGTSVLVPLMNMPTSHTRFNYGEGDGYRAIELPYVGESSSMVVLLPDAGGFDQFEQSLDSDRLQEILSRMSPTTGSIALPKFEFESKFSLTEALRSLGMEQAFDDRAEFLNMSPSPEGELLYIQDVIHQAFVSVDEEGTEAAAATAVIVGVTSLPSTDFEFVADRPFMFLIRDTQTGAILFLGRVLDPTAS